MIEVISSDKKSRVTVVLDAQAGSCGKGKFIGYLARKDDIDVSICNFMSNAGHTFVFDSGTHIVTQQLPTSIVNADTDILMIGPEAAITPQILFDEILKYQNLIGERSIYIHPNAVVIKKKHKKEEEKIIRSGSTFKGCGCARADKVVRQAELFGEWWNRFKSGDALFDEVGIDKCYGIFEMKYIIDRIVVKDTLPSLSTFIDDGFSIIVEGSQGCDLDINYGLSYPHTTSRQCHVGQLVADCGISPMLVDDIIMIMRPYPIRISNTTNIKKIGGDGLEYNVVAPSGDYGDSEEITWEEVKRRCGAPDDIEFGEQTTVTKKTRRVFEMNWDRLRYVVKLNRPTQIALNFAQYIDWRAYECTKYEDLPQRVTDFIDRIEEVTGVPVTLIGTGARNCDIIDRR